MSNWTKERLVSFITTCTEESLSLEYKSGEALADGEKQKPEITKDVSAFANAAGGVLIYGISEFPKKRHFPERLSPIRRSDTSKEWLEQVIQTIQPRIDGVIIHPVVIDEKEDTVCYVVEVPQSHTAHQARDRVYYKRHNFNALPMEDYEVRDIMNRKTHPKIRASLLITFSGSPIFNGFVKVKIENLGRKLIHYVMAEIELPICLNGNIRPDGDFILRHTDNDENYYLVRLVPSVAQSPIFPMSNVTLGQKIERVQEITEPNGTPSLSTKKLKISVFADEMIPITSELDPSQALNKWMVIELNPSTRIMGE